MREQIGLLSIITIAKITIELIFPNLLIPVNNFCLTLFFLEQNAWELSKN
jgi:hypothetical protein